MSTSDPIIVRSCPMCGKPEHGSMACEWASPWPTPGGLPPATEAFRLDPNAPGGPLDRIADALTRIATALASNTDREPS